MPPAVLRDINKRWARPLEFSAESSAGGGRFWRRPAADGLELFDPAWRVLLRTHAGVVGALIDIRLASAEHQEYQPDHLVRDGVRPHKARLCRLLYRSSRRLNKIYHSVTRISKTDSQP